MMLVRNCDQTFSRPFYTNFLGDHFTTRTWRGMNEGLDSVLTVEDVKEGRSGIANSYQNETDDK